MSRLPVSVPLPVSGPAAVVARGEWRRTLRNVRETPRQAVALAISGIFFGLLALAGVAGAYFFGAELRTAEELAVAGVDAVSIARSGVGLLWFGTFVYATFRTVTSVGDLEQPSLSLTAVSIRDLVAGRLLAETAKFACWTALPFALVTLSFAVGARAPAAPLAVLVVATLCWAAALVPGFLVGLALVHAVTRYEPLARLKTPLSILVGLAYFGLIMTDRLGSLAVVLAEPLRLWPISWLADAVALSVPAIRAASPSPSLAMAAVGAVGAVALSTAAWRLAVRFAEYHWLSEPVQSTSSESRTSAGESRLERLLAPVASRPTLAVATAAWRRTRRAPIRLLFVAYPLFFLLEPIRQTFEAVQAGGAVPETVPPLVMAYAVWAAGTTFTLNPLGDLGAALPATLSAPRTGRAVVRGHLLVGVATSLPPAALLVGAVAVGSALPPLVVAALVLATAVGIVAATALAVGIGVAFPRFGAVTVTRNREAVIPSKTAAAGYSLAVLLLVGALALVAYEPAWEPIAAILSALSSFFAPVDVSVSVTAVRIAGALSLVPLAIAPVYAYRYAVRTVADYRLE